MAQRAPDVVAARRVVVDDRIRDVVLEGNLRGPPCGLAKALAADVVGDGDQPVLGLFRPVPLLDIRAVGVQEGRLRDVLGVGRVPHDSQGVAIDVTDVSSVDPLERAVRARSLRQQGRHALVDTPWSQILLPRRGMWPQGSGVPIGS